QTMTSTPSTPARGRVIFIGAGPGDPGLLTTRGLRVLADADVVVYDRMVAPLLRLARPDAERIEVGAPAEGAMAQDAIAMLVADKAREGRLVARLKWGDPFLFGSGAKEALFLHEQGLSFEVVPGVPLAFGSAYAGVPLSYPGGHDALTLLRGHEATREDAPDVHWRALASLEGTIAAYATGRQAGIILRKLVAAGRPATHAAAFIHDVTLASQRTVTGTLASLITQLEADGADTESALLVVGDVAALRAHLRWFDERPLFGRRIVVTRSGERARDLADRLEDLGARALEAPTFRLMPAEDPEAIERAVASVRQFQWVVCESANAAHRFMKAVLAGGRDLRALGGVKVAAVGPSTADQLRAVGLMPDVVVPESGAEATCEALAAYGAIEGARVLVIRPDHGRSEHAREGLAAELRRRGADAQDLVAYRTAPEAPESGAAQELYRQLLEGRIDAVTFTTPAAVQRFVDLIGRDQAADLLNTTVVATIGPVTAAAAQALGVTAPVVADTYTVDGLIDALVKRLK
ncbi:MAG: uroporphyrinogen-III synthase, partial [Acidobacteria bacterium]|nr:uroporphyrinogen-III synthase [Acidobacteriota bacterium]